MLEQYEDVKLTPLSLRGCSFGKPFTSTNVTYEEFYVSGSDLTENEEERVPQVKFRHVYQQAFEYLNLFINGKLTVNNEEITANDFIYAVGTLQHFLSDIGKGLTIWFWDGAYFY